MTFEKPGEYSSETLSPEVRMVLSNLWLKVLAEGPRPEPEFVLIGRLNEEGSVHIKLAGGDEAHCRSEESLLRERDPGVWTDYAVIPFGEYRVSIY